VEEQGRRWHGGELAAGLGGKGNEGVSAFVQRIPDSLGYVEYAYAKGNKLTYGL